MERPTFFENAGGIVQRMALCFVLAATGCAHPQAQPTEGPAKKTIPTKTIRFEDYEEMKLALAWLKWYRSTMETLLGSPNCNQKAIGQWQQFFEKRMNSATLGKGGYQLANQIMRSDPKYTDLSTATCPEKPSAQNLISPNK
ncbi:hypothetical protein IPJ72_01115 [Candidatus Peregrinibacteria bacterium]|nr:MAG: hypothetical protein IPJ72_01115 [Candidatus Peregrinibacteria bacterium]